MTIAVNWDVQHQTKPKTVWTQIRTVSGFKPFDTLIVFLKEFKKKKKKKKIAVDNKKHEKLPSMLSVHPCANPLLQVNGMSPFPIIK